MDSEERKRLLEEWHAVRRQFESLQGKSPEVREQKMMLRNRYEEIRRLLEGKGPVSELTPLSAEERKARFARGVFCGAWWMPPNTSDSPPREDPQR